MSKLFIGPEMIELFPNFSDWRKTSKSPSGISSAKNSTSPVFVKFIREKKLFFVPEWTSSTSGRSKDSFCSSSIFSWDSLGSMPFLRYELYEFSEKVENSYLQIKFISSSWGKKISFKRHFILAAYEPIWPASRLDVTYERSILWWDVNFVWIHNSYRLFIVD